MSIVHDVNDGVKCEEFSEIIKIAEGKVRQHVEEVVRTLVEETLSGLLEAEADELCGAKRYARSMERLDTRAGHYERELQTKAGRGDVEGAEAAESAVRDADVNACRKTVAQDGACVTVEKRDVSRASHPPPLAATLINMRSRST